MNKSIQVFLNYKTLIFDCDGVILDSNKLKSDAFAVCVKGYSREKVNAFIAYHKANGGVSRYVKFEFFLKELANDYSANKMRELLQNYEKITIRGLLSCHICDGAIDFIKSAYRKSKLYVVSGGSEKDLRYVFMRRNLDKYFHSLSGSPKTKHRIFEDLRTQGAFDEKALYFGDSKLDHQVAKEFGTDFIFIYQYTDFEDWLKYCTENQVAYARSLSELLRFAGFKKVSDSSSLVSEPVFNAVYSRKP